MLFILNVRAMTDGIVVARVVIYIQRRALLIEC